MAVNLLLFVHVLKFNNWGRYCKGIHKYNHGNFAKFLNWTNVLYPICVAETINLRNNRFIRMVVWKTVKTYNDPHKAPKFDALINHNEALLKIIRCRDVRLFGINIGYRRKMLNRPFGDIWGLPSPIYHPRSINFSIY